jgi:hypothetical protein
MGVAEGTELEATQERGLWRVYDAGKTKWVTDG